jgi:hypothetical protein
MNGKLNGGDSFGECAKWQAILFICSGFVRGIVAKNTVQLLANQSGKQCIDVAAAFSTASTRKIRRIFAVTS